MTPLALFLPPQLIDHYIFNFNSHDNGRLCLVHLLLWKGSCVMGAHPWRSIGFCRLGRNSSFNLNNALQNCSMLAEIEISHLVQEAFRDDPQLELASKLQDMRTGSSGPPASVGDNKDAVKVMTYPNE